MSVFDYPRAYEVAFSYRDVPHEVDALLKWHGGGIASVLELAAGPADHALDLAGRGLSASTLDLNPAMCARAAERATERGVALTVATGDMVDFDLGRPFDLVFCLIDSLAHVLDLESLTAHLHSVRRHLAPGGAYIVETLHPADGFGVGQYTETDWTVERDGVHVRVRWGRGDEPMNPLTQVTDARVTIDVRAPWGEQRIEETMAQRFWTRDELRAAARLAGLEVTAQYGDFDGGALDAERAWRMISVLRA